MHFLSFILFFFFLHLEWGNVQYEIGVVNQKLWNMTSESQSIIAETMCSLLGKITSHYICNNSWPVRNPTQRSSRDDVRGIEVLLFNTILTLKQLFPEIGTNIVNDLATLSKTRLLQQITASFFPCLQQYRCSGIFFLSPTYAHGISKEGGVNQEGA